MQKFLEWLKSIGVDLTGKEDQLKAALAELQKSSSDEVTALKAEIETLKKNIPNPPNPNPNPKPTDNAEILALKNEITELKALLTEQQKTQKEQADAAKTKLEADRQKKIADLKAKGIAEGRITEASWTEKFKAMAEKDVDTFEALLPSLAIDPHFKPGKTKTGNGKETDNNNGGTDLKSKGPISGADKTILQKVTEMNNN